MSFFKEIISFFKKTPNLFKKVWSFFKTPVMDFIERFLLLAVIVYGLYINTGTYQTEIKTVLIIVLLWTVFMVLSSLTSYIYTPIKFTQIPDPNDKQVIAANVLGKYIVLGCIVLSIALIIGLTVFGVYFVQFIKP